MPTNSVIKVMLRRKTIRSYTDKLSANDVVTAIVRAGQQEPFAS